eukprot:scaffold23.g4157.t1
MDGGLAMPFGFRTTAAQVVDGLVPEGQDLAHHVAVITGGNSGIGVETARALARRGAAVVLTSRKVEAGEAVAADLRAGGATGSVTVEQLDLADTASIEAFAKEVSKLPKISLLLLNAGVMAVPRREQTADGFELQTGTNHIGHLHLLRLLLPKLQKQARPARGAGTQLRGAKETSRVVAVASYAEHFNGSQLHMDDLNWERRPYSAWRAYGQSKLCNILMAKELARRAQEGGWPVKAYSLHPGSINTPLTRHLGLAGSAFRVVNRVLPFVPGIKTVEQGAATTCYAALAPELDSQSGAYLKDCAVGTPSKLAQDAQLARELWAKSEELLDAAVAARQARQ